MNTCFMFLVTASVCCFIYRADGKYVADNKRDSGEGYRTRSEVYQSIKEAVRRAGNGIDARDLDKVAKLVQAFGDRHTIGVSSEDVIKEITEAAQKLQVPFEVLFNVLNNQNQDPDQIQSVGHNMDTALKIWNALADKGENALDDDKVLAAVNEIAKKIRVIIKLMVTEIVFYAEENKPSNTTDGPASIVVSSLRAVRESSSISRIKRGEWSVCLNVMIVSGCYSWQG